MGQKVHPIGFRITSNPNYTWQSIWYSDHSTFADKLLEDIKIRGMLVERLKLGGLSKVVIERASSKINVNIHSSKPGVIIGKKGADIASLKLLISRFTSSEVIVNIVDVKRAETDASLVAQNIATQLEKRISFRKAVKRAVYSAMKMGAKGIRVNVKGRIGGSDIARMEWYREGSVPLHTIRAQIDYAQVPSYTKDGIVGVKVWIHHEEKKVPSFNKGFIKDKNVTSTER
jgi:small subunit ribosomal protein S3